MKDQVGFLGVKPELGVTHFLRSIGSVNTIQRILSEANIKVTRKDTEFWRKVDVMPRYIYDVLNALTKKEDMNTASGDHVHALEIFIDEKFVARVEIPRNVEIKLKKRKNG